MKKPSRTSPVFIASAMDIGSIAYILLSERRADGTIPHHPYQKWRGAHWVLAMLAEIGHPMGDRRLVPLREQVLSWLLSERHIKSVRRIKGRYRRCASQEGYAAWAMMRLGLADRRVDRIIGNLVSWQWPDGGWNCDKDPKATISSFHESWLPLRALALHHRLTGSIESRRAADRAAGLLLGRRVFLRKSDGKPMSPDFLQLAWPSYWHFNVLSGLTALAESGHIRDRRCLPALKWLESRALPGGFPADRRYFRPCRPGGQPVTGQSLFDWGRPVPAQADPLVTAAARSLFRSAGRPVR
jgi:hypothetical protein